MLLTQSSKMVKRKRSSSTVSTAKGTRHSKQYGGYDVYRGRRYQSGGATRIYIPRYQQGGSLGGLFRGFLSTVSPHLKKGLMNIGKRALKAGANALEDMSTNNTSFKDAVKKQAKREMQALNPINMMKASAAGSSSAKRTKSRRKKRDIRPITL